MASIDKMANDWTNIASITLSNNLRLDHGLIALSGNVSGLATGTTTLATVPAGQEWVITHLLFNAASFTGLTGTMTASIGTVAATYDNIMPATALTGFDAGGELYVYPVTGTVVRAVPTDNVTVNVSVAYTGGTSGLFNVVILGLIT